MSDYKKYEGATKTPSTVGFTKRPCEILPCKCVHPGQDKLYGKGRRVHNPKKNDLYTCTVCGEERRI